LVGGAAEQPAVCQSTNTVGRLGVRSLGVAAKRVRMPAVLSSPCPHSCPASGVQCPVRASAVPGVPVHVTGVRCGRPSVQVSSVRPPASVRCGVRGVSDGNEVTGAWRWGRPPHGLGMAGVGVVARHGRNGASSARGWSLASKLAQAVLGQRRVTWSSWEVVSSRPSPSGRGWMRARFAHRGLQLVVTTLRGHYVRPGPGSAGL
jgi:hypothetical protein